MRFLEFRHSYRAGSHCFLGAKAFTDTLSSFSIRFYDDKICGHTIQNFTVVIVREELPKDMNNILLQSFLMMRLKFLLLIVHVIFRHKTQIIYGFTPLDVDMC